MFFSPSKLHPLLSCTYPSSLPKNPTPKPHKATRISNHIKIASFPATRTILRARLVHLLLCRDSVQGSDFEEGKNQETEAEFVGYDNTGDGDGEGGRLKIMYQAFKDWSTSGLLFGLWAGLMYYVFKLAPDQTPYRDMYFLQKLLNLKGDDGFHMNQVLVALWYIMGLWPLLYSMMLLPTGRSSRSKIPVWPFLTLSFFGGAYALIPYFVLWKPPPPSIAEDEISKWPLNFLESKVTAGIAFAAGLGLITYAGFATGEWKEFYQYFRESKFIHATSIDFSLLSAFAPFWIYNDMTARRWTSKGSWLLPFAFIPVVGPALYLLLRPPLSALPMRTSSDLTD